MFTLNELSNSMDEKGRLLVEDVRFRMGMGLKPGGPREGTREVEIDPNIRQQNLLSRYNDGMST